MRVDTSEVDFLFNFYGCRFFHAKPKGSICLFVKSAATAFWLCTAALSMLDESCHSPFLMVVHRPRLLIFIPDYVHHCSRHFLLKTSSQTQSETIEQQKLLYNLNFYSLQVRSRYRDPKLQVRGNHSYLFNFRLRICKS